MDKKILILVGIRAPMIQSKPFITKATPLRNGFSSFTLQLLVTTEVLLC